MQIYWIAALVFGIGIALFAVQNTTPVTISFLWLSAPDVPASVLVLICAALGALVTGMFGLGREVRMRLAGRAARRQRRALEQRVAELEAQIQQMEDERTEPQAQLGAGEPTPALPPGHPAETASTPETQPATDTPIR